MRALTTSFLVSCGFSTTLPTAAIDSPALPACPAAPAGCTPFDCQTSPTSCYYYCATARSSSAANTSCMAIATGACLVTLSDATESTCVLAATGAGSLIYVGLHQSGGTEPAGGWGWYCGSSIYGPNWSPGEPNDSGFGGEDCAAIDTLGRWVDVGCNESFRFVCEAPRPAS